MRNSIWKIGVFSNKTVFIGIASILALQAMFIYAPFMHEIFASAPPLPRAMCSRASSLAPSACR
ncbi:MAG: cation transporting ATPase C-terminal domain-containing protein [Polaromonas sp.]|nr:cation transporting ATPase C-terminal domain-containing protein [Polaromonas sp.]